MLTGKYMNFICPESESHSLEYYYMSGESANDARVSWVEMYRKVLLVRGIYSAVQQR